MLEITTIHYVEKCQLEMLSPICIMYIILIITLILYRDSSLILLSSILFILNIITFIQMTCFFRDIKFENLVIFNGIIYSLIIAASIITKFEFILEIGFGLHIVILSYIIRRFLHLSTSLMKRTLFPTLGQKIVFYLINIGNFVLLSLSIGIALIEDLRYFSDLIELVYRIYVVLITVFFLITGLIVLKLLNESTEDDSSEDIQVKDSSKKVNHQKISLKEYKETYYGKRKQQIITLIITNLITSVLQGGYCLVKNFLLTETDFFFMKLSIVPMTILSLTAYSVYISSCLLSIIAYYVSFFWVIRLEFIKTLVSHHISLPENEIKQSSPSDDNASNEDVKEYFHKSTSIKANLASFELV